MDLKYRIRLKNERVIGPFSTEEIGELLLKGHIVGSEMCQQFPIGDWRPLPLFPNLKSIIEAVKAAQTPKPEVSVEKSSIKKDATLTSSQKKPIEGASGVRTFTEFKFGKDVKIDVNYAELEQKYKDANPDIPYEDGMEKTVLIRRPHNKVEELDKTVVVRAKTEAPRVLKKEFIKPQPVVPQPIVELKEEVPEPSYEEMVNERTEFINLAQALPTINAQLSVSEVELERQAKIEENLEKKRLRELQEIMLREQAIEDGEEESEVEIVEEYDRDKKEFEQKVVIKRKKKGMSIVAVLAFVGIFYFFLQPEEKPKYVGPVYTEIKFPITAPNENAGAANTALAEARNLYSQGTYKKRLAAAGYYLASLQQKFSNSEAMGEIILTYTELLDNTKDKHQAANTLYKYIQLADAKLLIDASAATGTALFYGKIGKYQTGIYIVKNYLRAGNKPTPKMLTYYLSLLMNAGEFVEARSVYEALLKIPKKPFESYYQLSEFNNANDNVAEAKAILEEGLKYYPNNVLLLLSYSELLIKEQAIKKYEETLVKVNSLQAENSPVFQAYYYKQMGYLAAFKNKNKEASELFKRSLAIRESEELRSTLSKLEIGGDKVSQTLILESKVIGLLKKAKSEYKNRNIDTAFQLSIEAVDANPDYIPAVLFQAQLNTDRGFFESAIYSLQKIIGVYQQNNLLKKALTETYIKSYKFEDAERLLSEMAQSKYAVTPEYASLMGQFSEAKKNPIMAIKWYDRALARDPLSDLDMYRMARILVRNKRFPEARNRLSKALLLDPKNVNYHALYSEILYEQDGTDTAIGYLRDIISEIGEDPVLISAIATAYFKSGQIKEFQAAYKKVQNLPKKDEGFYEFLIAAAKLEGRKDEYIQHSRDLLRLNPGNLRVRMDLGELLYDEKRYDEAIMEFTEIKDKLDSYPRVHYQLARVYLAKNDLEKAKAMAQKELELNPNLDAAHFIMGEVYRLAKDYREAVVKYEKAISLNPRSVDALVSMAIIRLGQNYASEALELLSRALKEDLTNPTIHKLMGDAYRAAGQRALAKEKYEDYLKINPVAQDKDLIESLIRNLK
ncbi:tetratricopeptide repeat protein [Bacteriovorax sp. PP10]|uniref:Tetratricopeptide repeat protein n=1 Tax=Bacteriovorax antarcticus TaxID=3088717 RepID=A0ABU5VNZ3_9BACT|nr:tetratricopeptide repeat protein [Bacteriovorax sp. PP10]MEA9354759.1 tetratricopeptide repeat protein [Bacteriovorax sp. PP10]